MNLDFSPEDLAFRDEVRAFIAENYPASLRDKQEEGEEMAKEDFLAWHRLLAQKGWVAPAWPTQYGGPGWTSVQRYIWSEETARADAPSPLPFGVNMVGPVIYTFGTPEQKAKFLPGMLSGEDWWCQGYSEPGAGSDLASLKTSARIENGEFVINGQKIWTSTAKEADMIFCLVRTEGDAAKHHGISYLIFSMQTPGIEVRPLKTMTGSAEFNETFFTDVRVPLDQIVGQRGQGWFVANATLGHERGMLGDPDALENRLLALIDLMRQEQVDGHRVIDLPAFRDRLGALQAEVAAMKYNGMRILSSQIKGESGGMAKLIVKLQACELAHQISALAIDALGELGLLYHGSPHERAHGSWQWNYMFQLGLIIGGGTAQIQKNIISERGLNMPREPRLASQGAR